MKSKQLSCLDCNHENEHNHDWITIRRNFSSRFQEILADDAIMENITTFEPEIVKIIQDFDAASYALYVEVEKKFTFYGALFYCCYLCTTIKHTDISPYSLLGRTLSYVYTVVGIPLFIVFLLDFGMLYAQLVK
ncbi:unnamed protein product [Chironomus riparius]|uniref:Potassium channel domain-containing protein n=1 Tax=Chironomus riparius TaxID=315576 RepID=A0A9N9SA71_9DIPT|nr:unnamed protein product [Chironomus riparius]